MASEVALATATQDMVAVLEKRVGNLDGEDAITCQEMDKDQVPGQVEASSVAAAAFEDQELESELDQWRARTLDARDALRRVPKALVYYARFGLAVGVMILVGNLIVSLVVRPGTWRTIVATVVSFAGFAIGWLRTPAAEWLSTQIYRGVGYDFALEDKLQSVLAPYNQQMQDTGLGAFKLTARLEKGVPSGLSDDGALGWIVRFQSDLHEFDLVLRLEMDLVTALPTDSSSTRSSLSSSEDYP